MNLRVLALSLFAVGCAQQNSTPEGELIENHSRTASQVKGLLRSAEGPFVRGQVETLTAVIENANVRSVSWSATGGTLSARDTKVSWTLPELELAELTLTLHMDDGSEVVTSFSFSLVSREVENPHVARSAREALLTTPMPVLDGGSEISGGACDLAYDATGANVHLAFTSGTHPAVYYARWNGSAWTIEVMDTLGFNTGGRISPNFVQLRLDGSGNPHIAYVRDNQVWYATRSGATWTRERVDSNTSLFASNVVGFNLNASGRPSVVYDTSLSGNGRVVFATRMGANNWTQTQLIFPVGTNYESRTEGELLFDAAGVAYFPVEVYGSTNGNYQNFLASWNGTATEVKLVTASTSTAPGWDLGGSTKGASGVWAAAGRPIFRTAAGVYDITLATPLANSTFTWSAAEQSGAGVGDLAWNGRPVILHHHSSNLELVTPSSTGAAFWTWTQLGGSSSVSASLAVHPTTGVASICYQASGRIMFQ